MKLVFAPGSLVQGFCVNKITAPLRAMTLIRASASKAQSHPQNYKAPPLLLHFAFLPEVITDGLGEGHGRGAASPCHEDFEAASANPKKKFALDPSVIL